MFGSATPAGFYLPARRIDETQRTDETQPLAKKPRQSVSRPPRAARILGRRYALTATSFKYLEIGISVGPVSTVEIVVGDNRGTQLLLPYATWKILIEKRGDILRMLDDSSSSSPLWIRDLAVEVCTLANHKVFKMTLSNSCIYFNPTTIEYLFTLEQCVDIMYAWLMENTHLVNTTFQSFCDVLREKNITDVHTAAKAIRESDALDAESLIDCELLACALNDIMYNVIH